MCTLITGLLITSDEDHCEYRVCGCHLQLWAVMCKLASSTALWRMWGPEARRSHGPVEQEASYSSVCKGQFGHFVKMSKTPMSQHTFSLSYLYTHKCYSSRVIVSFCHFHYKHLQSNYDSLGITEQVSTSVQEMLKPFERFWSYGSDWFLGFSVACQLEILKVGRFRNSAFFPRCQSEVDVKQIRHKHGQVFLRALDWDGLLIKSKWNYFVKSETNSSLQNSTATCPVVHPTVYLDRSSLKAIAQKKKKKKKDATSAAVPAATAARESGTDIPEQPAEEMQHSYGGS